MKKFGVICLGLLFATTAQAKSLSCRSFEAGPDNPTAAIMPADGRYLVAINYPAPDVPGGGMEHTVEFYASGEITTNVISLVGSGGQTVNGFFKNGAYETVISGINFLCN